jgi:hypothetical protein
MPVFHFVLHAYGTWHPDHPRGWHQHGDPYPLRPDIPLARHRRKIQRWESAEFIEDMQQPMLDMVLDICRRRTWRCHAAAINITHIHIVASWPNLPRNETLPPDFLHNTFKRLLGLTAAKLAGTKGRPWFSTGGKPKRVRDIAHLHWLKTEYLPKQGGLYWVEEDNKYWRVA